jgi:hypothetical protein
MKALETTDLLFVGPGVSGGEEGGFIFCINFSFNLFVGGAQSLWRQRVCSLLGQGCRGVKRGPATGPLSCQAATQRHGPASSQYSRQGKLPLTKLCSNVVFALLFMTKSNIADRVN